MFFINVLYSSFVNGNFYIITFTGQLAQLCMWQMVVGYKLRELEALEKGASMD